MIDPIRGPQPRTIEGAPDAMRLALLDALYLAAEHPMDRTARLDVNEDLYLIVSGALGVAPSADPNGGRRQRMARDLVGTEDWRLVFELIVRLWREYLSRGRHEVYLVTVNHVLAIHGIAWELGADGQLHRVLPIVAQGQVVAMFEELAVPALAAARELAAAAQSAYDARPRRDRDVVSNIFDAVEAAAKVKLGTPNATFGDCVTRLKRDRLLNAEIIEVLERVNTLRNRNFGHGMADPFAFCSTEVDFVYLVCVATLLLLAR